MLRDAPFKIAGKLQTCVVVMPLTISCDAGHGIVWNIGPN